MGRTRFAHPNQQRLFRHDLRRTAIDPMETKGRSSEPELLLWQRGMELAKRVSLLTNQFPAQERFGLVTQIRRTALSIPTGLMDAPSAGASPEWVKFLAAAEVSLSELDTLLGQSIALGYCTGWDAAEVYHLIDEIRPILHGLRRSLPSAAAVM